MYYLNSRYYNPEIGRFINADGLIGQTGDILGHNMFTFTENNPINFTMPNGSVIYSLKSNLLGNIMMTGGKLTPHSLPTKLPQSEPNIPKKQWYPNGELARERVYDEDGNALVDHDHHAGEEEAGYDHDHDWDWSKNPPRQPARPANNTNKLVAGGVLVVSGIGLIWLVGNDITGVGVADDALVPVATTSFVAAWLVLIGKGDDNQW